MFASLLHKSLPGIAKTLAKSKGGITVARSMAGTAQSQTSAVRFFQLTVKFNMDWIRRTNNVVSLLLITLRRLTIDLPIIFYFTLYS